MFTTLTVCYSLLAAQCSLLTAHYSLLTAHLSLLATRYSLLATRYSLPTAHCPLLTLQGKRLCELAGEATQRRGRTQANMKPPKKNKRSA